MMQYNPMGFGNQITDSIMTNMIPAAPPPPMIAPPDPTKCVPVTAEEVLNKMRERYLSF